MVVSSVTPLIPSATLVHLVRVGLQGPADERLEDPELLGVLLGRWGAPAPAVSHSRPLWTSIVASPPSSRIMFGALAAGQVRICSVQSQYSSSVSPFQANTGTPAGRSGGALGPTTTAAAASSWVE